MSVLSLEIHEEFADFISKKKNNYHIHCKSNNWCLLMEMKETYVLCLFCLDLKLFKTVINNIV